MKNRDGGIAPTAKEPERAGPVGESRANRTLVGLKSDLHAHNHDPELFL